MLEKLMAHYNGEWKDGKAIIFASDGYYWIVAEGTPEDYVLTSDGKRFMTILEKFPVYREVRSRGRLPKINLSEDLVTNGDSDS